MHQKPREQSRGFSLRRQAAGSRKFQLAVEILVLVACPLVDTHRRIPAPPAGVADGAGISWRQLCRYPLAPAVQTGQVSVAVGIRRADTRDCQRLQRVGAGTLLCAAENSVRICAQRGVSAGCLRADTRYFSSPQRKPLLHSDSATACYFTAATHRPPAAQRPPVHQSLVSSAATHLLTAERIFSNPLSTGAERGQSANPERTCCVHSLLLLWGH